MVKWHKASTIILTLFAYLTLSACVSAGEPSFVEIEDPPTLTRLTHQDEWYLQSPSWSPDEAQIVMEGLRPGYGTPALILYDFRTRELSSIFERVDRSLPHWSPLADSILYYRHQESIESSEGDWLLTPDGIWVTDSLGSREKYLRFGYEAVWGPNSDQITIFEILRNLMNEDHPIVQIVGLDGIAVETIYPLGNTGSSYDAVLGGMEWSPDRSTLLISISHPLSGYSSSYDIFAVKAPDWQLTSIAADPELHEWDPGWLSDGRWVYYLIGFREDVRLEFKRLVDGCTVRLLEGIDVDDAELSPKSNRMAITYRGELYVLDLDPLFSEGYPTEDIKCGSSFSKTGP